MYPTTFHEKERVLSPPSGQHEDISGLRVLDIQYEDGSQACVSCWQLEPEEIEQFKKDGKIYIAVMGRSQPPILPCTSLSRLGVTE